MTRSNRSDDTDEVEVAILQQSLTDAKPPDVSGNVLTDPLADALQNLWNYRSEPSWIEVHFDNGNTARFESFCPELSRPECGVFTAAEQSGYRLVIVPWRTVRRIEVRQLVDLPELVSG